MAARTGLAGVSLMVEGLLSGSSQRGWSTVLTSPLHQTCGGWRVGGGGGADWASSWALGVALDPPKSHSRALFGL